MKRVILETGLAVCFLNEEEKFPHEPSVTVRAHVKIYNHGTFQAVIYTDESWESTDDYKDRIDVAFRRYYNPTDNSNIKIEYKWL